MIVLVKGSGEKYLVLVAQNKVEANLLAHWKKDHMAEVVGYSKETMGDKRTFRDTLTIRFNEVIG